MDEGQRNMPEEMRAREEAERQRRQERQQQHERVQREKRQERQQREVARSPHKNKIRIRVEQG